MPDEPGVIRVINAFRDALLRREEAQMLDMVAHWLLVENALEGQITALALDIDRRRVAGETIKPWRLAELERYRSLLAQAQGELVQYTRYADVLITEQQVRWGNDGAEHALTTLDALYRDSGVVRAAFDILPTEVIESMAGLTASGSPLRNLLAQAWPDAVDGLTQALVEAIAKGQNPRVTARMMANGLAGGLQRCLVLARTEQLRVYREATRQQYIKSGVVTRYKRIAAKQGRTCLACILSDGKVYELESAFEEHPCGRCALVPIVEDLPEVTWTNGRDWFSGLKADEQQAIMGKQLFTAWKAGKVEFDNMVKTHQDETWGNSLVSKSLKEMGL